MLNAKRYYTGRQLFLLVFFALEVIFAVLLLEPLYSACSIDVFLLARIERMAHRADFSVDFLSGTAGLKCVATTAVDQGLIIFWMYILFHTVLFPKLIAVFY